MPKFKITAPDGSRKFIVTSEDAEAAVHDLKDHLSSEHSEAMPIGEFGIVGLTDDAPEPPQAGLFGWAYAELFQRYAATTIH